MTVAKLPLTEIKKHIDFDKDISDFNFTNLPNSTINNKIQSFKIDNFRISIKTDRIVELTSEDDIEFYEEYKNCKDGSWTDQVSEMAKDIDYSKLNIDNDDRKDFYLYLLNHHYTVLQIDTYKFVISIVSFFEVRGNGLYDLFNSIDLSQFVYFDRKLNIFPFIQTKINENTSHYYPLNTTIDQQAIIDYIRYSLAKIVFLKKQKDEAIFIENDFLMYNSKFKNYYYFNDYFIFPDFVLEANNSLYNIKIEREHKSFENFCNKS